MLRSVRELQGYGIQALDGPIGRVHEMLFHDDRWVIRYLVVDTGKWLPGRKVLISPISVESIDAGVGRRLVLHLHRDQIRNSPDLGSDEPVSRQREAAFYAYYGYGPYWAGPGVWGPAVYPRELRPRADAGWPASARESQGDPHLRSTREVIGYHIVATDGEIGHIDDFVIDAEAWTIRHVVVDTSDWPGGRTVQLSPASIRAIDWAGRRAHVDLSVERVRNSPERRATELPR